MEKNKESKLEENKDTKIKKNKKELRIKTGEEADQNDFAEMFMMTSTPIQASYHITM